jgi:hypothetical protein
MRMVITTILAALAATTASAQIGYPTAYPAGPYAQYPTLGYTPNGTRVINPWGQGAFNGGLNNGYNGWPTAPGFANSNQVPPLSIWNPSLNPYQMYLNQYQAYANQYQGYANQYQGYVNQYQAYSSPFASSQALLNNAIAFNRPVQVEAGRVVPVSPGLAVNPVTGTVVSSFRGIALTNEGPFYRVPNSGSITPWGRYIPGSGVYVNPFTGSAYNPATGLIVR